MSLSQLDAAILRLVARPVRLWCLVTGKSNFALARILGYCSGVFTTYWIISLVMEGEPIIYTFLLSIGWGPTAAIVILYRIPQLKEAEKKFEQRGGDPLPLELSEFFSEEKSRIRLIRLMELGLSLILVTTFLVYLLAGDPGLQFLMGSGATFSFSMFSYVISCVTPGGKSKVKEFLKRFRFSAPKLRTAPKPTPA